MTDGEYIIGIDWANGVDRTVCTPDDKLMTFNELMQIDALDTPRLKMVNNPPNHVTVLHTINAVGEHNLTSINAPNTQDSPVVGLPPVIRTPRPAFNSRSRRIAPRPKKPDGVCVYAHYYG